MVVDNLNPTSQFHPYQPPDATPVSEKPLKRAFERIRDYARSNPGRTLGALAAVAIGLGLLRRR